MIHELVPPYNHRSNLAERAIQTFKHHFISILSGVDDKFPLSLWCALLEQTELTAIQRRTKNIGVRPCARPAQLHEEAICAN
jgi:hypothetical protein